MPHMARPCTPSSSSSLVVRAIEEHLGNNWVPTDWQHKQGKGRFRCKQRETLSDKAVTQKGVGPGGVDGPLSGKVGRKKMVQDSWNCIFLAPLPSVLTTNGSGVPGVGGRPN